MPDLTSLIRRMLPYVRDQLEQTSYGGPTLITNPHHFYPDEQVNTPQELAAHQYACDMYDCGEPVEIPHGCSTHHDARGNLLGALTVQPWGVGISYFHDPEVRHLVHEVHAYLSTQEVWGQELENRLENRLENNADLP
jgi:hypothetical protein